ncbi:hypothetical protein IT072_13800 [Leifsonia sp. ZF2019]|uniref:hypothetical protein n=1 Tax=Leifsonia sp. ZF2019 TaxID=2781978 RepID=UPI001CBDAC14|nr:hypothetical protein [Leifsonia sp. ZF2019]UAJ78332.1 hypothetical protein IT072_13800 [Leifsonia sp. ZF2019]
MSGIASDDFRDGAATGASMLAKRLQSLALWNVRIDSSLINDMARGVQLEMGGQIIPDGQDPADLWDDGFTACAHEHMKQREDPTYPIHRPNPYRQEP